MKCDGGLLVNEWILRPWIVMWCVRKMVCSGWMDR